ncbi:MAG: hypothetical protein P8L44_12775 [Opitutales bacterium]|nr:hypothetical protein [Opitutales bacterium]
MNTTTINKQHPILFFVILALLAMAPFSNAQTPQPSEEQLAQSLKRFPEADTNKDGKLTTEEIQQFRQSRRFAWCAGRVNLIRLSPTQWLCIATLLLL